MTSAARRPAPDSAAFIAPGAMLGVLGGGQLGRMFAHAAQRSGYAVAVLDPDPDSPAGRVAEAHIVAPYTDADGLRRLADRCAAVTTEFENVPANALQMLAERCVVSPHAASVSVCQDRAAEKTAFTRCGVACAPWVAIEREADLESVRARFLPGILKTSRLGYDGKGQRRVADRAELAQAFAALGGVACVLEKALSLTAELSVIAARGRDGTTVHLPVQENLHRDGILALTRVPVAAADARVCAEAIRQAGQVAEAIDHVGVLCVEFFLLDDGSLVANEMAPRPHNSGHHSIDSCDLSQFDLQHRVLTNAPLVAPRQHSAAVMLNLLGELWLHAGQRSIEPPWADVLALPGTHLHLYGKREARAGRKMGHLTVTAASAADAEAVAVCAAALLGIEPWPSAQGGSGAAGASSAAAADRGPRA